jgi:biotin transport system substrate-specific component
LSARIAIPLPFTPVPLTLQVLVVIVSGFALGPGDGMMSQLLYLQAILLGAPITAAGLGGPGALVAPTAGYLWAFPLAAAVAGWIGCRPMSVKPVWRALGGLAALAVIYTLGMSWLSAFVGSIGDAFRLGVLPFLGADVLKIVIAAASLSLKER